MFRVQLKDVQNLKSSNYHNLCYTLPRKWGLFDRNCLISNVLQTDGFVCLLLDNLLYGNLLCISYACRRVCRNCADIGHIDDLNGADAGPVLAHNGGCTRSDLKNCMSICKCVYSVNHI